MRLRPLGTYGRVKPAGARIARLLCDGHTISLLPDCLSSRLSGTLDEVERAVVAAEAAPTRAAAAEKLRPEIGVQGALRWLDRRRRYVRETMKALRTMAPTMVGAAATLTEFLATTGTGLLVRLRSQLQADLYRLPKPVGLVPLENLVTPSKSRTILAPHNPGAVRRRGEGYRGRTLRNRSAGGAGWRCRAGNPGWTRGECGST